MNQTGYRKTDNYEDMNRKAIESEQNVLLRNAAEKQDSSIDQAEKGISLLGSIFSLIYYGSLAMLLIVVVSVIIGTSCEMRQREHDKRVREIQREIDEMHNKNQQKTNTSSMPSKTPSPGFTPIPYTSKPYIPADDDYEDEYDYWYDDYDVYDYDSPEEFYKYNKSTFKDYEDAENYYYDHGGQ